MAFIPPYPASAARGNVFHGATAAAGVLIPISTTTSPTFGLWNPTGSGKNANLISIKFSFVSTTGAPGGILYNYLLNAGSQAATAAPITVFNQVTQGSAGLINGLIGGPVGIQSVMKFTNAGTNTLTTAGTIYGEAGISQLTTTGATTSAPMYTAVDYFNNTTAVAPGTFWYVTGSAALLSLFNIHLTWEENPQ